MMNLLKKNPKTLPQTIVTAGSANNCDRMMKNSVSSKSENSFPNRMCKIKRIPLMIPTAISALLIYGSGVLAMPRTIYETSQKQTISRGITLEKIKSYTEEGWLSISVVRADMTDPYVYADVMTDPDSIQNTISPLTAAQTEKAVAAVNGSFFMYTGSNNKIIPIGAVVDSGQIKTAYMELNNATSSMATLSISDFGDILCDFWKTEMWLESSAGVTFVTRYNRPYYSYTDLTVIDRTWSTMSAGTAGSDIVEVIVQDETVTEIRSGKAAVTIPSNGFVIVSKGVGGTMLQTKFKAGDKVSFHIITGPTDWNWVQMAVTGGSLILKNGVIPSSFSNSSPGRNPRTAMGVSRNGKELIMVTVDGRQNSSIGLTQTELAELMIRLGAYNAVNFDGGGSTAMVARLAGNISAEVVNSPSEGVLRRVANAVGVFSRAPAGGVARLVIDCEDSSIFAGSSRTFTAKAQDEYYNPVSISSSNIIWGAVGVSGRFSGNTFYPSAAGSGKISATYNGVTSYYDITVLEPPEILIPGSDIIELVLGETQKLTFEAADARGRRALINARDITFSVVGDGSNPAPGVVASGVFTANAESNGYIKATLGNAVAYIGVRVPKHWTLPLDDFQMFNGTFSGYPQSVTGSYGLSYNHAVSGNISGRLAFNFLNEPDNTRAAYLDFIYPIPLEPSAIKLSLEVYNTKASTAQVRAEVIDTGGNVQRLVLSNSLNWTGWKHLEADLDGFTPAFVKRIYVVQMSNVQETGEVYFDDLTAEIPIYAADVAVPAD
ncbi:MAG: phosphodiester glycosidase family protein, partial [Eubacteriales bacterium]|nr:phosphodiester glycosidase family protein [Eubacteriales bacterium]